jgi:DNA polymerase-3 subunit gamma/tau
MSNTLYRKYRPQTFSDVIGQKHIVQTLTNAIKNNRIGQAYLFTGPRGTGKTTMARIFAKSVNCLSRRSDAEADQKRKDSDSEPCMECAVCKNFSENRSLDIMEIDAASNTGVDNIRELRETVKLPPSQAKYKVYIIDEVHMLSIGAFNALLKTLEEPPAHVIFILATTAIHKVPGTIISRCQRFDFSRLTMESIIQKLTIIAKSENIKIEKEALEMIAIAAEGGMRDAESLLAQVISLENKNITAKEVADILGTADHQIIAKLAQFILEKKLHESLELINKISSDGYNLEIFGKSLVNYFRQMLLLCADQKLAKTLSFELTAEQIQSMEKISQKYALQDMLSAINHLLETQTKISASFIPQLPLEIAASKICSDAQDLTVSKPTTEIKENHVTYNMKHEPINAEKSEKTFVQENKKSEIKVEEKKEMVELEEFNENKNNSAEISIDGIKSKWELILKEIKPFNHSLSGFLANCQPIKIEGNTLTIATKYSFYKERLNENANKLTMEAAFAKILETQVRLKFVSEEEAGIKIHPVKSASGGPAMPEFNGVNTNQSTSKQNNLMSEAMKIMGGKIVND